MKIKNGMMVWVKDWSYHVDMFGSEHNHMKDIRNLEGFILKEKNKKIIYKGSKKRVVMDYKILSIKTGKLYYISSKHVVYTKDEAVMWFNHYAELDILYLNE